MHGCCLKWFEFAVSGHRSDSGGRNRAAGRRGLVWLRRGSLFLHRGDARRRDRLYRGGQKRKRSDLRWRLMRLGQSVFSGVLSFCCLVLLIETNHFGYWNLGNCAELA